eukprot:TRINITY_DN26461_c0_g1_i1.p2 TRINITY_DN26461_c0_g1~~TRINITY_DN26461_c0_g1_i1.p2  ORF type:complete len:205 (-),score=58.17 TRINITY_DN26461_c0_g1_i1:256-870(-)
MWPLAVRGIARRAAPGTTLGLFRPLAPETTRTFCAGTGATTKTSSDGGASSEQPGAGAMPNPMHLFEQLHDQAQKVTESAGVPKSMEEAQAKLREFKGAVEEKVPSFTDAEEFPQKLSEAALPFVSAGAVLMRAQGEIKAEDEEKLLQVLPEGVVQTIKRLAPAIPKDPNLEVSEALLAKLDSVQGELASLKQELAALNKSRQP